MNELPLISVVMGVYKTPIELLNIAVKSILDQSFSDFEFIIICDGDVEAFNFLLNLTDKRIRLYKNFINKGLAFSLNRGIKLSKGRFIFRMDADDISLSNRFDTQLRYLNKGHHIVSCLSYQIDLAGNIITKQKKWLFHNFFYKILLYKTHSFNPVVHMSVAAHREVFDDFKYDNSILYAQDYELWKRMQKKYKIYFINKYLVKYRVYRFDDEKSNYQAKISARLKDKYK